MEQKVIILTRTSSGIGYETADGRNDGWQTTLVMALMERSKT